MRVILPKNKVLDGQPLYSIANSLNILDGAMKELDENNVYFQIADQSNVEILLTQDNVINIVNNGGEIEGYIMWAKMPYQLDGVSIYEVEVPEGLRNRTMYITTGDAAVKITKKLAQWCDTIAKQYFSDDYQHIYMLSNPQGYILNASELKIFVDVIGASLITREEYNSVDSRES